MVPSLPPVDICVLSYNTRDLSVLALRRLLDSEQGVDVRLFVRDNGSTDGTVEALRRAVPEAWVDAGSENVGFAAGMNTLFARTTAPYVLCLNSDAWPLPGALATLVAAAERLPDVAAVAPRLLRPDGSLEHSTWPFPSVGLSLLHATGLRYLLPARLAERFMLEPEWGHDRTRRVGWAVGAALLFPRSALDLVGGFDERFFMYGEDVDWCWRARERHGLQIWFAPAAVVCHVGGVSAEHRYPGAVMAAKVASSARLFRSHHGALATAAYRGLEAFTAAGLWAAARYRGDPIARAHWVTVARANLRLPDVDGRSPL